MAINERLVHTTSAAAAGAGNAGEEGLILHLDANDVDSYDGDGTEWVDITNHEYTPATNVSEHFNTVLYTGNNANNRGITGVGFQPDLVWIKNRDAGFSHMIYDSVRGATGSGGDHLSSDTTGMAGAVTGLFDSFDYDGFTIDKDASSRINNSPNKYVAWCFKAGGAPSGSDTVSINGTSYADEAAAGLTAGTIAVSGLSANTDLGFSVVKVVDHTGTKTISHGLGTLPELIITKVLDSNGYNWYVYHKDLGNDKYLNLNAIGGAVADNFWNYTNPASQVFTHRFSSTAYDMIYYCFASKRGVSKVGSYTGTGAAGNKIYTGFEPAFLMVKSAGSGEWNIWDNARDTDSSKDTTLWANSNTTEAVASQGGVYDVSFDRDGFTQNSVYNPMNANGVKYIYYAVAKNTNETSLIPDTDLELGLDTGTYSGSGDWLDSSGNGNNGTITGATWEEELGNSFEFDGSDDFIDFGDMQGFGNELSVELWVNPNSTQSNAYATVFDFEHSNDEGWVLYQDNTITNNYKIALKDGSSWDTTANTSLTADTWHHVVFTVDSSNNFKLYVNNTNTQSLSNWGGLGTAERRLNLGCWGGNDGITRSRFWNGQIGQFRIYDSALSLAQIRQNFNFTKNDYPNGFNAALTNMSSSDFDPSDGHFTFSADSDRMQTSFQPNVTVPFTASVWVKRNSGNSGYKTVIDYTQNASPYNGFGIFHSGTGDYGIVVGGGTDVTIGPETSGFDHLVFVYNGGTSCKTYINGVGTTRTLNNAIAQPNTSTNFVVGNSYVSTWSSSRMDVSDVKFYDRALTDDEVTAQHSIGYNGIG